MLLYFILHLICMKVTNTNNQIDSLRTNPATLNIVGCIIDTLRTNPAINSSVLSGV